MNQLHRTANEYQELVYNAHTILRDYYTFDELRMIPMKDLFGLIDFFKPKLQEIARRQEQHALELELQGKRNQKPPGRRERR